jgi:hypothetical protein
MKIPGFFKVTTITYKGRVWKPFEQAKVILLKAYRTGESDLCDLSKGSVAIIEMMPNGNFYLCHPDAPQVCLDTRPVEGKHFKFMED